MLRKEAQRVNSDLNDIIKELKVEHDQRIEGERKFWEDDYGHIPLDWIISYVDDSDMVKFLKKSITEAKWQASTERSLREGEKRLNKLLMETIDKLEAKICEVMSVRNPESNEMSRLDKEGMRAIRGIRETAAKRLENQMSELKDKK